MTNYNHIYEAIHAATGGQMKRVLQAINDFGLSCQPSTLQRNYQRWVQVKKLQDDGAPQPVSTLNKLQVNLNEFENIVNELAPELNTFDLPPSQESNYQPYKLPINHNNILIIGDIHVPYHNIPALTLALKYGLENGVNTILLNGDIIDFYAISRFEKDPRKRNFGHEVLILNLVQHKVLKMASTKQWS